MPLLLGLLLYAPAFFGEQAYSFVLGIDQIAAQGISWSQPLGGLVQSVLDSLALLHPTSLRLTGLIALGLATALLVIGLTLLGVHPAGAGLAGAALMTHPAAIAAVMKLDNTGLALAVILLVIGRAGLRRLFRLGWRCSSWRRSLTRSAFALGLWRGSASTTTDAARAAQAALSGSFPHRRHRLGRRHPDRRSASVGAGWADLDQPVLGLAVGEFLPWAPEIAAARLDLAGASGLLTRFSLSSPAPWLCSNALATYSPSP